MRPRLAGAQAIASDLASAAGYMVPSLLIAPVTEGTSVVWLPALLLGTATAGDTYNTERRAGMPDRQAVIYSAAVGAVEGGLGKAGLTRRRRSR
ncbi:hypothetical protein [Papillibacter cinnamivorans]|nr:hypothetical protein [Papillibacter cinnamivorans]